MKPETRIYRMLESRNTSKPIEVPASIGKADGTTTLADKNYVWVTTIDGVELVVFNDKALNTFNNPVWIGTVAGDVINLRVLRMRDVFAAPIPAQPPNLASNLSSIGSDPLPITGDMFVPWLVRWSGTGLIIEVYGMAFQTATGWLPPTEFTFDLTSHLPSSAGARWVLVSANAAGGVDLTDGNVVAFASVSLADIPATPANSMALSGVLLEYGQTQLRWGLQTSFIDLRYGGVGTNGAVAVAPHKATHISTGTDPIDAVVAAGASGLMTGADKTKLDGIASGAEVNVNADWNAVSGDALILNKPTIPTSGINQLTGDVTAGPGSGSQAAMIANSAVTLAKMANLPANTIIGNNTGGSAVPKALTVSEVNALLNIASYYGVTWNESTDAYARTGILAGLQIGSTPGDTALPIQKLMRRCIMNDAGTVVYYLDPADSTKKANGSAANLTGADGQVMVEIPAFYIRYSYGSNTHNWDISLYPLPGFSLHPAFLKNGSQVAYRYCGAYEACLYDASKSTYAGSFNPVAAHSATFDVDAGSSRGTITAGAGTPYALLRASDVIVVTGTADNNGTYIVYSATDTVITTTTVITGADGVEAATVLSSVSADTGNDKLASVSGRRCLANITRANVRLIAAKRGTGWRQLDFYLLSAIQLLYLVEYASFNSQTMIGAGISNTTDWATYNNYYPIAPSGNSNVVGNASGNTAGATACATEVSKYLSYRGIENWFGHIWKWVDGINVNNNVPYVSNIDTQFANDTASNYANLGVTLGVSDGWQATLAQITAGFLPLTVGASSTTKVTDYYYQGAGWRVALFGGDALGGAGAGGFCYPLNFGSGSLDSDIGGRLAY